jgi:uncharacterized repeat protein (TIGR03803 family)
MQTRRLKPSLSRALCLAVAALILCLPAQGAPKYKVLHTFTGGADGAGSWGGVTLHQGKLYGTGGGGAGTCNGGCGVVFKLTPGAHGQWTEAVLHSFAGGSDGYDPYGGVILDGSGNLYGTTVSGGTHNYGTVFELTQGSNGWQDNILYNFEYLSQPVALLAMDQAGNLYGTTPKDSDAYELARGSDGWGEIVLHNFTGDNGDGAGPYAGVILDAAGNLYGTTQYGGPHNDGIAYELSPVSGGGWKETLLHRFDPNGKDGVTPSWGALFMDHAGSLYGTTRGGGTNECGGDSDGPQAGQPLGGQIGNCGTVYRLTNGGDGRWKETILYSFNSGPTGYSPNAGVVMDKAGNLYGTTDYGGWGGCGVIYKLAPGPKGKWTYTVLYAFLVPDGCQPEGNLVLDQKGNLYGGTVTGGAYRNGVVFELTP